MRGIKVGNVMTYKMVAEKAGRLRACARSAPIMKKYDPTVPCHRVVRSDGVVGDYNRGGKTKKDILT